MQLHELQTQFLAALCDQKNEMLFLSQLPETSPLSAQQRFAIYRNNILLKTLSDIYPVCEKLVGQEFFVAMSQCYIEKTSAHYSDFTTYGTEFPAFIAIFPPTKDLVYLADVARLELAWHKAYYADHYPDFDFHTLQRQKISSQEKMIFHVSPTVSLLQSVYPIHAIWQQNQANCLEPRRIDLAEGGVSLFIGRRDEEVCIDVLTQEEWELLSALRESLTLAQLYERFQNSPSNPVELLPKCIEKGWISHVSYADSPLF